MDRRESRLKKEFERMLTLTGPNSLIDFRCADLSMADATELLKTSVDLKLLDWENYLPPGEFKKRHPDSAPEKYMVGYSCAGLMKTEQGEIVKTNRHGMIVIYGYDYPEKPPILIWRTPIWHPNIKTPQICAAGRAFAVSVPLDQIVLTIGEMVQYRNFNLRDPLDHHAAAWARENLQHCPVDDRDLVDSRRTVNQRAASVKADPDALIEILDSTSAESDESEQMVEIVS